MGFCALKGKVELWAKQKDSLCHADVVSVSFCGFDFVLGSEFNPVCDIEQTEEYLGSVFFFLLCVQLSNITWQIMKNTLNQDCPISISEYILARCSLCRAAVQAWSCTSSVLGWGMNYTQTLQLAFPTAEKQCSPDLLHYQHEKQAYCLQISLEFCS